MTIPTLTNESQALDLANALNSLSGVAHIEIDVKTHTVTVLYDPDHAGPDLFFGAAEGTGYVPVKDGA
jgi:copper chaperone CopZ